MGHRLISEQAIEKLFFDSILAPSHYFQNKWQYSSKPIPIFKSLPLDLHTEKLHFLFFSENTGISEGYKEIIWCVSYHKTPESTPKLQPKYS